jgi:hypothetical protein
VLIGARMLVGFWALARISVVGAETSQIVLAQSARGADAA